MLFTFLLLLLSFIVAVPFYCSNKGFLAYHSKKEYQPLYSEDNSGFYGRINYYLNKALNDTSGNYDLGNLNSFYNRLEFFYPADSLNYLVRNSEIRLIGYKPDSSDKDEIQFFYNSDFKKIIDKQANPTNLTSQYFIFKFDLDKASDQPRIKSIRIDTAQFRMQLHYDYWKGTIAMTDPWRDIDSNLIYLEYQDKALPLFSNSTITTTQFHNRACQWLDIDFPFAPSQISPADIYQTCTQNPLAFRVRYSRGNNAILLLNRGDSLFIQNQSQTNALLILEERDTVRSEAEIGISIERARQARLLLQNGDESYLFHLTSSSAFNRSSIPVKGSFSGSRFRIDPSSIDLSLQQQLKVLENVIENKDSLDKVSLSSNAALSAYLERQIRNYVTVLKNDRNICTDSNDIVEMSISIMDANGEILATPFYGNYFALDNIDENTARKNFNLELHDIGSTFKPLLYMAAVTRFPSLAVFELNNSNTNTDISQSTIIGYKTNRYGWNMESKPPAELPLFWQKMPTNRQNALRDSHDNYPVAVTLLSLTEDNDPAYNYVARAFNNSMANSLYAANERRNAARIQVGDNGKTSLKDLPHSTYFRLLNYLFDIQVQKDGYEKVYDTKVFPSLPAKKVNFLSPEIPCFFDSTFLGAQDYDLIKLKTDILGQGNNRWSNIKLAEAYTRILTGRHVAATFLQTKDKQSPSLFGQGIHDIRHTQFPDSIAIRNAWLFFKRDWRRAVMDRSNSLLFLANNRFSETYNATRESFGLPDSLQFYCKTGTPQEYSAKLYNYGNKVIYMDEGLFAFGIITSTEPVKGVIGVIHIKHLSSKPIVKNAEGRAKGVESTTARDFLSADKMRMLLFYCKSRFQ